MAEIVLFSPDVIRSILKSHVEWYCKHNFEPKGELDQDVLDELEAQSTTAYEAFRILFADREEFYDEETTKAFFSRAASAVDDDILQTLQQWMLKTLAKVGIQSGLIYRSADTPEELEILVSPFIKTNQFHVDDDGQPIPSLWPVVELVRLSIVNLW